MLGSIQITGTGGKLTYSLGTWRPMLSPPSLLTDHQSLSAPICPESCPSSSCDTCLNILNFCQNLPSFLRMTIKCHQWAVTLTSYWPQTGQNSHQWQSHRLLSWCGPVMSWSHKSWHERSLLLRHSWRLRVTIRRYVIAEMMGDSMVTVWTTGGTRPWRG